MDPIVTGGLIKAGASLLGGLFGKKDKGPTMQQQLDFQKWGLQQERDSNAAWERARYTALADGARAAGFNPLTVLRAAGGGSAAPSVGLAPLQSEGGGRDWGGVVADIGDDLAEMVLRNDPIEKEYRVLRNELMRQDLTTQQNIRERTGGPLDGQNNADDEVFIPDPHSVRPEDARIKHGQFKGRYLSAYGPHIIMMPANYQPHEGREAMWGGATSEFQTLSTAALRSLPRVRINEDGTVTILSKGVESNRSDAPDTSGVPATPLQLEIDNNYEQPINP